MKHLILPKGLGVVDEPLLSSGSNTNPHVCISYAYDMHHLPYWLLAHVMSEKPLVSNLFVDGRLS